MDPDKSREAKVHVYDNLAMKYGMSREQAASTCQDMNRQAESVGLHYNFDGMFPTNTFDAHRLALLAAKYGKRGQMVERLFYAYFTEGKHLSDANTLIELATEVGLDSEEVSKILTGDEYSSEVRADEQEAANLGVRGVPFFVINRKYGISGAQPSDVFLEALEKAWHEEHPLMMMSEEGEVCDETGCKIDPEVPKNRPDPS